MPTAFVQLARTGDLVSALPFMRERAIEEGQPVACYVAPAFAAILEACSYVKPILRRTHHRDLAETANQAKRDGYDPVIVTQVHANPFPAPEGAANFIQEQWIRAGYWGRFHDLPLVFDRRDREAEAAVLAKCLPEVTGRPILAYSLSGHSSPFADRKAFAAWVKGAFGYQFQLLDLSCDEFGDSGGMRLERPQHLLPLIEAADVCLFTDSLPLHLTYDPCTPVFALHRDSPAEPGTKPPQWWWSSRRRHWIGQATYQEAMTPDGRRRIAGAINDRNRWPAVQPPMSEADRARRIVHVADWYGPAAWEEARRNLNARESWLRLSEADLNWVNLFFHSARHGRRSSANIGDARNLPYLRDVFDWAVERAGDDDIVCFTNTDSVLCSDAAEAIRRAIARGDCAYSHRIQIDEPPERFTQAELRSCTVDGGTDLFAFKASWWRKHREEIPDFLLGCDAWDCCLRKLMDLTGGRKINPPIVLHARHAPFWKRKENIEANPGQKHNRSLYRSWCDERGVAVQLDKAIA